MSHDTTLLSDVEKQIQDGESDGGLLNLILVLKRNRDEMVAGEWKAFVAAARLHPLCQLLHNDPFTHRTFHKPRGYAGDAEMIDYIYDQRVSGIIQPLGIGKTVFDWTTNSPASVAVRRRRTVTASYIDQTADAVLSPEILSVAAGHLREAELSEAVRQGRLHRLVAFDQDKRSLEVVQQDYGKYGVTTEEGSVRQLLSGKSRLGQFDLVYTAGLYDYFDDRIAVRVTRALFSHVKPGGRLLIANFVPSLRDVGYMECFMDWWLVYRSAADMNLLTGQIPVVAH